MSPLTASNLILISREWTPGDNMVCMLTMMCRLEERVRNNVQLIKDSPHIRQELKDRTRGFVYDIKTGRLTEQK